MLCKVNAYPACHFSIGLTNSSFLCLIIYSRGIQHQGTQGRDIFADTDLNLELKGEILYFQKLRNGLFYASYCLLPKEAHGKPISVTAMVVTPLGPG